MEISMFTIYLFTRLDAIKVSCVSIFLTITILSIFFGIVVGIDEYAREDSKWGLKFKKSIVMLFLIYFISFVGTVCIPTQKEIAAIYLIPKIVNNEQSQELPDNFLKLLNSKLKEYITESVKEN
jgi:hypothetical protein